MINRGVHSQKFRGLLANPALWLGAIIFAVALWLNISAWFRTTTRELPTVPIGSAIPMDLPGWTVADLPLGPTETGTQMVVGMLQFDDYVYRRFSRGAEYFGIYIAYWGPEKMAVGEVAKHTPDVCWVQNGMQRLHAEHQVGLTVGQDRLKSAEVRLFDTGANKIYVAYWHIVNGRVLDHSRRQGWSLQGFRYWLDSFARLWRWSRRAVFRQGGQQHAH